MSGAAESLNEAAAQVMRTLAFAMGAGIALLALVSIFLYARSDVSAPTMQSLKLINWMTIVSMAASAAAIVASEIAWKRLMSGAVEADVNARVQSAFIVRSALREGAALLGTVTFFLACQNGVLRGYPAYWVDLVPAALFWSYLYFHWPSLENLKIEVAALTGA